MEEATWRAHAGVVVPIPTRVFSPPFTYMALGLRVLVVVANLESNGLPEK